ncbi:hypothetical protein BD410DRAFT_773671 [Rickenella mellea]|uniref:Uncharacterized protein n=1 Tax=Rickenella mellea TaxID=50990 RepID=A0A4Y7PWD8_9AGAM|nr:hypothetical protein BD410DRAFT_773671 [Rickenella mellea]
MAIPGIILPLTTSNSEGFKSESDASTTQTRVVHAACSAADPIAFASWGFGLFDEKNTEIHDLKSEDPAFGVVLGCADGSIFLYHPSSGERSDAALIIETAISSSHLAQPQSRYAWSPAKLNSPRSSSPSSRAAGAPLSLSKSRVVSGLSKEQVEAPKNYVDFEEEQEKLKDMIHDRAVKDKTLLGSLKGNASREINLDKPSNLSPFNSSVAVKEDTLQAPTHSPSFSESSSPSSPPSPIILPTAGSSPRPPLSLSLKAHIFPKTVGFGHSVTDVKFIEEGRYFLCLQESGFLSFFDSKCGSCISIANVDSPPVSSQTLDGKRSSPIHVCWKWKYLHVTERREKWFIVACASPDADSVADDENVQDKSRLCVFELRNLQELEFGEVLLEKAGDFEIEGAAEAVGSFSIDFTSDIITVCYISITSTLVLQDVRIQRAVPAVPEPPSGGDSAGTSSGPLSLPNPFKALTSKTLEQPLISDKPSCASRIELADSKEVGSIPLPGILCRLQAREFGGNLFGAVWSEQELLVFCYDSGLLRILCNMPLINVNDLLWHDRDTFSVVYENRAEYYMLQDVDHDGDPISAPSETLHPPARAELILCSDMTASPLQCIATSSLILSTRLSSKGFRRLELHTLADPQQSKKSKGRYLWSASGAPITYGAGTAHITTVLPLELNEFIIGYSDGAIARTTFSDMVTPKTGGEKYPRSNEGLEAKIVSLHLIVSNRTKQQELIGGGDDGAIAAWDPRTLKLRARWIVFTSPLAQVIELRDENVGRLRDCALCISEDGTIAVVVIDGLELLYLIPGSGAHLKRICLGEDNLLLIFSDGRARLWDVKTREFWRSMDVLKADGLLEQGGWFEASVGERVPAFTQSGLAQLPSPTSTLDSAACVLLDVEKCVGAFGRDNEKMSTATLDSVRAFLSALLIPGLDANIDQLVREKLHVSTSTAISGIFNSQSSLSWFCLSTAKDIWKASSEVSASRLISIVVLLRVFLNYEAFEVAASAIAAFYTTSLPDHIGESYQSPNLAFLAHWWWESPVAEIRQTARMLFEAEVARLSEGKITSLIDRWQHRLPCVLPDGDKQSASAASALFLCANIAVERFNLLTASILTDISKSLTIYLNDETSPHRVMAIDLCSRGFQVWQHYFDAMDALRSLISLATSSRKESISLRNPGTQARLAVLQIASSNTPLFMTTLSLDILNPRSVEYSKSVMQLLAFLIRKKPLVLYPSLPRLIEAVVKSLDPSSSAGREAVLESATEILGQVVRSFPTVDFHTATQRLALGTSEGAVIMYDLKTATRLYVLDGHRKRLAAISFSPDGRRLVTLSLEECVVLVWKVGSSISSFFHPGAPPRQGHSGSDPFKTFNFNIGDEANMTVAATLEWVTIDWPAERSVRIRIRDSTLTFTT